MIVRLLKIVEAYDCCHGLKRKIRYRDILPTCLSGRLKVFVLPTSLSGRLKVLGRILPTSLSGRQKVGGCCHFGRDLENSV